MSADDQAVPLVTMVRGNTMVLVFASRQNLFLVVSTGWGFLLYCLPLPIVWSLCCIYSIFRASHETLVKISRC